MNVDIKTLGFGVAGGLVLSKVLFFDGPLAWLDWCLVQAEVWKIQIAGLFKVGGCGEETGTFSRIWSHLKSQVSLWQLLGLEKIHRIEKEYHRGKNLLEPIFEARNLRVHIKYNIS